MSKILFLKSKGPQHFYLDQSPIVTLIYFQIKKKTSVTFFILENNIIVPLSVLYSILS